MDETQERILKVTIECLEKTFKVVDKKVRQEAEGMLKTLETELFQHCKNILYIIQHESLLPNENKLSVILYLKNMIKKKIDEDAIKKEECLEILRFYSEFIIKSELAPKMLENIVLTITNILNYDKILEEKGLAIEILTHFLKSASSTDRIPQIRGYVLVIESILNTKSVSKKNILEFLAKTSELFEKLLNGVVEAYQKIDATSQTELFLEYNHIAKGIFTFLYNSTLKLKKLNLIVKIIEVYIAKFVPYAVKIAISQIPGINQNYFISFTGKNEFDENINLTKAKCIQFINSLLLFFKKSITSKSLTETASILVEPFIKNLSYVINEKFDYLSAMEKDGEVADSNHEFLIYEILMFFNRFVNKEPILDSFVNLVKPFTVNILIPLLMCTKAELNNMMDDGEEYAGFIDDVISEYKNKTIKSAAAHLLENFTKKFDGVNYFIINYLCELFLFCLNGRNTADIQKYKFITQIQNEWLLLRVPEESQIEVCLLIFCILVDGVCSKGGKALFDSIKNMMVESVDKLMSVNSVVIKSRVTIFLGMYLDTIFENTEKFNVCIQFLFVNLFNYSQNQGLSHLSADSLSEIFELEKYSVQLTGLVKDLLPKIIEKIEEINFGTYYDVIYELIAHIDIGDYILPLSQNLTKRIQKEVIPKVRIRTKNQKDQEYSVVVNKCFNVLRLICETKVYVIPFSNQLEAIFKELYDYLKNPKKIEFDEDLVMMLSSTMRIRQEVSQYTLELLPYMSKFLIKSKGLMLDLFEYMNYIMFYGAKQIASNENYLEHITKIYELSITVPITKDGSDKSPFLGALLMQTWISHVDNLPQSHVVKILSMTLKTLREISDEFSNVNELADEPDLYVFISMLTLLYSGFVIYPGQTFEALITNNDLNNFCDWTTIYISGSYFNTYQSKLMIIGICSILRSEYLLSQFVTPMTIKFLNFANRMLLKQKKEESTSLKRKLKKDIDCNFISSDDEEEEADSDNSDIPIKELSKKFNKGDLKEFYDTFKGKKLHGDEVDEREIEDACERVSSVFKGVDEYDHFKTSIDFLMSSGYRNVTDEWVTNLSEKEKTILENLIHTRRITIQKNNVSTTVPRKIMKIKRSQDTETQQGNNGN